MALVKHLGETEAARRADDGKEAKPIGEGKGGQDGDQRAVAGAKIAPAK